MRSLAGRLKSVDKELSVRRSFEKDWQRDQSIKMERCRGTFRMQRKAGAIRKLLWIEHLEMVSRSKRKSYPRQNKQICGTSVMTF